MFFSKSEFTKLLKSSYKGAGFHINVRGNWIVLRTGYWQIEMEESCIPKEVLGTIVTFVGKLPKDGEQWLVQKDGIQTEMDTTEMINTELYHGEEEKAVKTSVLYDTVAGTIMRVMQDPVTGHKMFIPQSKLNILDYGEIDFKQGETEPEGPFMSNEKTFLLWESSACKFEVMVRNSDIIEQHLEGLEGICLL